MARATLRPAPAVVVGVQEVVAVARPRHLGGTSKGGRWVLREGGHSRSGRSRSWPKSVTTEPKPVEDSVQKGALLTTTPATTTCMWYGGGQKGEVDKFCRRGLTDGSHGNRSQPSPFVCIRFAKDQC